MNTQVSNLLQTRRENIGWSYASGPARSWWNELERINSDKPELILQLTDELITRRATLDDFFVVCAYSGRHGVRENLKYLDTVRANH